MTGLVEAVLKVKERDSFGYVETSSFTPELDRNFYPTKQQPELKIDVAVALMMAVGRAMTEDTSQGDIMDFLRNPVLADVMRAGWGVTFTAHQRPLIGGEQGYAVEAYAFLVKQSCAALPLPI